MIVIIDLPWEFTAQQSLVPELAKKKKNNLILKSFMDGLLETNQAALMPSPSQSLPTNPEISDCLRP